MSKEAINYNDQTLDPKKDVLVPFQDYARMTNLIQVVEQKHSKKIISDKYAWFSKKTNERLSDKSKAKMKKDKLVKEYYENIDMAATSKNVRVDRDELGAEAIQILAGLVGIFRHNVDEGNSMLRPQPAVAPDVAENTETEVES